MQSLQAYTKASGQSKVTSFSTKADVYTVSNTTAGDVLNQQGTGSSPASLKPATTFERSYSVGSLINNKGTFYFIGLGQVKIPFTSMQAFLGLGYSTRNVVNADLSSLPSAQSFFLSKPDQTHPWGSFLKLDNTIYYSSEQGMIAIPSWTIFLSNGGQEKYIVKMNAEDVKVLNAHPNLPLLEVNDGRVGR